MSAEPAPSTWLEDCTIGQLMNEILRRSVLRKKGLCDYCERPFSDRACRFPERHTAPPGQVPAEQEAA